MVAQIDIETQIRQTFDRIGQVLKAAGASFRNVVMLRSYFVHLSRDLPVYRKVRRDYLAKPYPASTAVGVTELAIVGLELEIVHIDAKAKLSQNRSERDRANVAEELVRSKDPLDQMTGQLMREM